MVKDVGVGQRRGGGLANEVGEVEFGAGDDVLAALGPAVELQEHDVRAVAERVQVAEAELHVERHGGRCASRGCSCCCDGLLRWRQRGARKGERGRARRRRDGKGRCRERAAAVLAHAHRELRGRGVVAVRERERAHPHVAHAPHALARVVRRAETAAIRDRCVTVQWA